MDIEQLKKIFRPSKRKILISLGLFAAGSLIFSLIYSWISSFYMGWHAPLPIVLEQTTCPITDAAGNTVSECTGPEYFPGFGLLNLYLWYAVGCITVYFRGEKE